MSRGFDGPEIDDLQNPETRLNRSPRSNSRAGWDAVRRLERIRGEEERLTSATRKPAEPLAATARSLPREERVQLVLAGTSRRTT